MEMAVAAADADCRPSDEAALIREAQQDRCAFGPIYERHADRVYTYLRSRTSTPEDAADLTQQVFLQALDALPRFKPRGTPLAAWLLRIARNSAVSFHRRQRQTVEWDLVPPALQPSAPGDHATEMEQRDTIQGLFQDLDATSREILILRFGSGLSTAEIATVIGKSEAATRMRLMRTLRTLKEHYDDDQR